MSEKNLLLLEKLIERIKEALESRQNTVLNIQVEVKNGEIKSVSWETKFSVDFV